MSDERNEINEALEALGKNFDERVKKYGDSPQASEHTDLENQVRRMETLVDFELDPESTVLDFGCGNGHLLEFLRAERGYRGEYTGFDISKEMIDLCQAKHPDAQFELRNILENPTYQKFDYIFICGTFNDLIGNNDLILKESLKRLIKNTNKAICFNLLSRYVDYFDSHLYYFDPGDIFKFCKEELSPKVSLFHDYEMKQGIVPYEFSVRVYPTKIDCRKLNNG